jgi:hypothetical protein
MLIVEIAIGVALGIFIANYFKNNLMSIKNDMREGVYKLLTYAIGLVFFGANFYYIFNLFKFEQSYEKYISKVDAALIDYFYFVGHIAIVIYIISLLGKHLMYLMNLDLQKEAERLANFDLPEVVERYKFHKWYLYKYVFGFLYLDICYALYWAIGNFTSNADYTFFTVLALLALATIVRYFDNKKTANKNSTNLL